MADNFEKDGLIADLRINKPGAILNVKYDGRDKFYPGEELTPTQVKNEPEVTWDADPNSLYALFMHDPDAPSRQDKHLGEWQHWAVINILGNRVKSGDVRAQYVGSGPPAGSGLHRYTFLVYKQPGRIPLNGPIRPNNSTEGRARQKIQQIAAEHNLEGPIAANYYNSQYDDYVPILHKQLGLSI